MDEFKVKPLRLKNAASEEKNMSRELGSIRNELDTVRNNLRFKIAQKENIRSRLNSQGSALNGHCNKMKRMSDALSQIADEYERTELGLCGMEQTGPAGGLTAPPWADLNLIDKVFPWWGIWPVFPLPLINKDVINFADRWIEYEKEHSLGPEYEHDLDIDPDYEHSFRKGTYDLENGNWTSADSEDEAAEFDDNMDRMKMDKEVKVLKKEASVAASWFTAENLWGDKDGSHLSAEMDAFKGEAYAEAFAGLYSRDPETGEISLKPGFGAGAGASVTAFTATEKAQLGSEALGVYAESTQEIGKLGASADVNVGLYDKDGDLDPSLHAGIEAEAIAGEISGTAGVMLAGTKAGITGSLNYGVGVHAEAGYKDGKLSVDVGATLGVGGSVKLEIDISGTVDAVCDSAKAAWDWLF